MDTATALSPALLKTPQAAARLGIGKRTFQERVAAGEIGSIKIGRSIRFDPADLDAFIERNRRAPRGWKQTGKEGRA